MKTLLDNHLAQQQGILAEFTKSGKANTTDMLRLLAHKFYTADQNIGTPWQPYVIDLSEVLTGISTIAADDADDDDDWWTLQGFKLGRKPTQPGVYIHHGKKVVIKLKK